MFLVFCKLGLFGSGELHGVHLKHLQLRLLLCDFSSIPPLFIGWTSGSLWWFGCVLGGFGLVWLFCVCASVLCSVLNSVC